ncbi:Anaphase-promoting complex subunit 1 [Rhizina undulata]
MCNGSVLAAGYLTLAIARLLREEVPAEVPEVLAEVPKVTIVHILDKAAAGATVALALIYMKIKNEALARKIDITDTQHLFDYIRPDIFLLRTVAKNLIMWDNIEGSYEWI